MRVAGVADLHYTPQSHEHLQEQLGHVRNEADVLVIAGDLTNLGKPEEMESLVAALQRLRLPIVAVLGNHDYESDAEPTLVHLMTAVGIKVLDGTAYERDGVGFAGTKGFGGGYGRGVLTAFGEREIKSFVQASLEETRKLERALLQLRTEKTVVVVHYAPILETVRGETPEIYPYLGTSRLGEVIDRHGANLVLHGHAHNGSLDGRTLSGIPVHNVSLPVLMAQHPPCTYRVFEV